MTFTPDWSDWFWSRVHPEALSGCWLWHGATRSHGYGGFQRHVSGRKVSFYAHRHAFSATYGEIPAGMYVCHRCDVPACVNPAHLFLGTSADNAADCGSKRRVRNQYTPVTTERHAEIMRRLLAGERGASIAKAVGCAESTVSKIKASVA